MLNGPCQVKAKACNFIKIEFLAQVFSCEFCEFSKNTFSYRTLPVAASFLRNGNIMNDYRSFLQATGNGSLCTLHSEVYSELCRTCKTKRFAKTVKSFYPVIFAKRSFLDVWHDSGYAYLTRCWSIRSFLQLWRYWKWCKKRRKFLISWSTHEEAGRQMAFVASKLRAETNAKIQN